MKTTSVRSVLLFVAFAVAVASLPLLGWAQGTANGTSGTGPKLVPPGVLKDDQIEKLKKEEIDPKTGKGYAFQASVGMPTLTPVQKKSYAKSGKVPFKITCALYEVKTDSKGKKTMERDSGSAKFYVQDADGKVVVNKSQSLSSMCPTWGGGGGYLGEVDKAGSYTVVVYVDKGNKGMYGQKMSVDLKAVPAPQ